MQIKDLPASTTLATTDVLPKETSGGVTHKITGGNLASQVKSLGNLVDTTEMNAAIAQSTATMVEYRTNTGDANTFADGITIVTNSTTSNIPATVGRCAVLTFTLIQSPLRKTQTALSLGQIWVREYTAAWGEWKQLQLRTV